MFVRSFVLSFVRSFVRSFIHSFVRSFVRYEWYFSEDKGMYNWANSDL